MHYGRFNYVYPLILTPLNSDSSIDFTEESVQEMINDAIKSYNDATLCSRTCLKELQKVVISRRQIAVSLLSEQELNSPGRALRTLSVSLVKNEYFKNLLTKDGKLFTTLYSPIADDNNELQIDASEITDSILQKCVIDAIDRGNTNITAKNALDEMKQICVKYGLHENYINL